MVVKCILIGFVLLVPTLIAVCGGAGPTATPTTAPTATPVPTPTPTTTPTAVPTPPPTPDEAPFGEGLSDEETTYIEQMQISQDKVGEVFRSVGDALDQTWPTRGRLLSVLQEASIGAARETLLHELEQFDPPDRFRTEHEQYVQFLRDQVPLTHEHDQRAADGDLLGVAAYRAKLLAARRTFVAGLSPAFCNAMMVPPDALADEQANGPADAPFCRVNDQLPGGEYGIELHNILKRFGAEFGPRVGGFLPALTREEFFGYLAVIQPEVEALLEETGRQVRTLEPPAELGADHDVVLRFLEETLEIARAITRAAENQERAKLETELFPLSGEVLCKAERALSSEIRPVVDPYFGPEAPEFCR